MTVKGNVIPTPDKLRQKLGLLRSSANRINFGNVFFQQNPTQKIEIENAKNSDITMTIADCPKYIKLKIKPKTLSPGERGEIQVTFDSKTKNTYGTSTDSPKISMKFGEQVYKGSINITAKIVEDFSQLSTKEIADAPVIHFQKKSINLGEIDVKQNKSIVLEFENRGKRELLIRNIEINNNSFTLVKYDKVLKLGGKGKLTLKTDPANAANKLNSIIKILSNDPRNSETTLRVYGSIKKSKPNLKKVKNIQTKIKNFKVREAYDLLHEYKKSDKLIIMDVRTPKEYENGCLERALNFNFEDKNFKKTIQLLDRAKIYLVYCKSGIRSEEAAIIMSELDFENIYHMYEGMDGWRENRLEVSDPGK